MVGGVWHRFAQSMNENMEREERGSSRLYKLGTNIETLNGECW